MPYVRLVEDGDARAFVAGGVGTHYAFRSEEDGELTTAFRKAVAEAINQGHTSELEGVERDVGREMAEQVGIRKDAADSLMIAWYPPKDLQAKLLALTPDGLAGKTTAAQLHLTLIYLGDPDADGSGPWDVTHVAAVCKIFSKWCYPLDAVVSGVARFVGPEDSDALVALVDSAELSCFRECLLNELCCFGALPYNSPALNPSHGFVPHITLGYVPKDQKPDVTLAATLPFKIDAITVCSGPNSVDFPLAPLAEDAVEEFGQYYDTQKALYIHKGKPAVAQGDPVNAPLLAEALKAGALDVAEEDAAAHYTITKSMDEDRYTLGPLYAPMRKDAHGDYIEAEELQKAAWEYVAATSETGRRIHLQHDMFGDVTVGEWVEIMAWPYDHEITLKAADGTETQQAMPAGTVYMGVRWDPDAWELVKAGKLGGYSLGGRAIKIEENTDLPTMGFAHEEDSK